MHRLRAAETGDIEAMTDLLLRHGPNPWNHLPEEGGGGVRICEPSPTARYVPSWPSATIGCWGSPASVAPRISPITSRSVPMRRGPTSARR